MTERLRAFRDRLAGDLAWGIRDVAAMGLLGLIPMAFFTLVGHVVLNGDNLIQNYPLRTLVGDILRQGQMPLWDPFLWAGTPLLAGFNAGAAYPLTWLFALIPPISAWTLTLTVTYILCAEGFYYYLRLLGRSPLAAWLGAVTFSFAGFMSGQMVHVDMIEGVGWLPWVAVAIHQLAVLDEVARVRRWTVVLGLSAGLVILVGSPEASGYGAVFSALLAASYLYREKTRWLSILGRYLMGAGLALLLGGVQWLPGLDFIHLSQRAHASFAFFASMSVPPSTWVVSVLPYILGGYHLSWVPVNYTGPFNLPELTDYVGLLPLIAFLSMVPRLSRQNRLGRWYLIVVVGMLWALGGFTPLGRVLYHIPLINGLRAQNRNLFMVDFGLAVIFSYWVDAMAAQASKVKTFWMYGPVVAVLTLVAAAMYFGRLRNTVGVNVALERYVGLSAGLAVVVALGVWVAYRLSGRYRVWPIAGLAVLDLALFNAVEYWQKPPQTSVVTASFASDPWAAQLKKWAKGHRYAIYNPNLVDYPAMDAIGQPDLNILSRIPSVQGYGSLVADSYQNLTGAHLQGTLNPAFLATDTADRLNLGVLLTPGSELAAAVSPAWRPGPGVKTPVGGHAEWFTGVPMDVSAVTVYLPSGYAERSLRPTLWKVGLRQAGGTILWLPSAARIEGSGRMLTWTPAHPVSAIGLELRPPSGVSEIGAVTVTAGTTHYWLTGPFSGVLRFSRWRYAGTIGPYVAFFNRHPKGWYWLSGPGRGQSTVRRLSSNLQGAATFSVQSAGAVRLVRSETYQPGWLVRVSGSRTSKVEAVQSDGGLQSIALPKGRWRVTFYYAPGDVKVGEEVSAAGILGLLVVGLTSLF